MVFDVIELIFVAICYKETIHSQFTQEYNFVYICLLELEFLLLGG